MNLVDLDDAAVLQQAIDKLQRAHDLRKIDPELRADIERTIGEGVAAGRITDEDAARLRRELDEVAPAVMLEANFKQLVPNRKTIGHYAKGLPAKSTFDPLQEVYKMDREDPTRLRALFREMAIFTDDAERIVAGAVAHARKCGIPEQVFEPIIANELREMKGQVRNAI